MVHFLHMTNHIIDKKMKNTLLQVILQDKTLLTNDSVLGVVTFSNIEMVLKITLLVLSIIWTVYKIINERKSKNE